MRNKFRNLGNRLLNLFFQNICIVTYNSFSQELTVSLFFFLLKLDNFLGNNCYLVKSIKNFVEKVILHLVKFRHLFALIRPNIYLVLGLDLATAFANSWAHVQKYRATWFVQRIQIVRLQKYSLALLDAQVLV